MKDEKVAAQPSLFGDIDDIFNALETELTMVNLEIDAAQATIDRKEKEIEGLEERQRKLSHAIVLVRNARKPGVPDEGKPAPAEKDSKKRKARAKDPKKK